jgi:predicted MPP superfamily phosphohydrolase
MVYFIAAVILIMILLIWIFIEQELLVTTQYNITSDKLGKDFDNTRFVVLADLHNHCFGKQNQRLVNKIDALTPDFIIAAGDIITKRERCIPSSAATLMQTLAKKYTVYYAYGNHEQDFEDHVSSFNKSNRDGIERQNYETSYSTWVEYKNLLKASGIILLDNQKITLIRNGSRLNIAGVSLPLSCYVKHKTAVIQSEYLDTLFGRNRGLAYDILIAHNPMYFKNYVQWGADLILSGHVHGGLVRLPFLGGLISPQVRLFPKYDSGIYCYNDQNMIISRGLGSHSIMFRLFNPPELVCILLSSNNKHT